MVRTIKNANLIGELKRNVSLHKKEFLDKRMDYFKALACHETIEAIDRECKEEALKENKFYANAAHMRKTGEYGTRVLSPDSDYHLTSKDFEEYSKLVDTKRKQKGLKLPYNHYEWAIKEPWNLSSTCLSREQLIRTKQDFLQVALKIIPKEWVGDFTKVVKNMEYPHLDKFLELSLRLEVDA